MPKPKTRPASLVTWTAAANLADAAPHDRLPCPGCAASVKGLNLADHVRRIHMADERAPRTSGRPGLVGLDRRIRTTGRALHLLWVGALAVMVHGSPEVFTETVAGFDSGSGEPTFALVRTHLETLVRTRFGAVLLVGLVLTVVAAAIGRAGRFRARVEVADGRLVLHHRLGTGTRRVALPAPVESGSAVRHHGASGADESGSGGDAGYTEHVGTYLRIGRGRRAITVACSSSTKLRRHWDEVAPGRERARWDITLAPPEFVALQYALAEGGTLVPRSFSPR